MGVNVEKLDLKERIVPQASMARHWPRDMRQSASCAEQSGAVLSPLPNSSGARKPLRITAGTESGPVRSDSWFTHSAARMVGVAQRLEGIL